MVYEEFEYSEDCQGLSDAVRRLEELADLAWQRNLIHFVINPVLAIIPGMSGFMLDDPLNASFEKIAGLIAALKEQEHTCSGEF